MSWFTEIAVFGAAYLFLSICVGLVLGRILRTMDVAPEIGTPELMEANRWHCDEDSLVTSGGLFGAALT